MQAKVALVIRPDGTVPFDDGHPHKEEIIGSLVAAGHTVELVAGTNHIRIVSGPLKPKPAERVS